MHGFLRSGDRKSMDIAADVSRTGIEDSLGKGRVSVNTKDVAKGIFEGTGS